jgi:ketosteroid isomerase-like protein
VLDVTEAAISQFFERDADRDINGIVSLFADDATVIDEGKAYQGTAQIRAWQEGPASKYEYTTEVTGIEATGADRYLASGRITGNFPGGTAELRWDFTVAGGQITRLAIAP